ncbi:hypothetical protein ABT352_32105 [Streptosporangium sp. NPDC000563]|uniref:hypothetical protein n=1 Tax=unclassified Streptosporangium TaxID=2632669 RepID=UPI0033210184
MERALDVGDTRSLRRSAEDDDTLVSAVDDPARLPPISTAGKAEAFSAGEMVAALYRAGDRERPDA